MPGGRLRRIPTFGARCCRERMLSFSPSVGMDRLPAAIPYLRDGFPMYDLLRVRRRVRDTTRVRFLPQPFDSLADGYDSFRRMRLTTTWLRITQVVRIFNPEIPVVLVAPGIHRSADYPTDRHHKPALPSLPAMGRQASDRLRRGLMT